MAVDPDPDGDYRSPVLNRLGRLLSAGHGGQVLLSHITAELVRDVLPVGAGVRDLGVAEAHRKAINFAIDPSLRLGHHDTVTIVQETLGEQAFNAAWEASAALTLEEAVAEALGVAEEIEGGAR